MFTESFVATWAYPVYILKYRIAVETARHYYFVMWEINLWVRSKKVRGNLQRRCRTYNIWSSKPAYAYERISNLGLPRSTNVFGREEIATSGMFEQRTSIEEMPWDLTRVCLLRNHRLIDWSLTPLNWINFLLKVIFEQSVNGVQLLKKSLGSLEPEGSSLCMQTPAVGLSFDNFSTGHISLRSA